MLYCCIALHRLCIELVQTQIDWCHEQVVLLLSHTFAMPFPLSKSHLFQTPLVSVKDKSKHNSWIQKQTKYSDEKAGEAINHKPQSVATATKNAASATILATKSHKKTICWPWLKRASQLLCFYQQSVDKTILLMFVFFSPNNMSQKVIVVVVILFNVQGNRHIWIFASDRTDSTLTWHWQW